MEAKLWESDAHPASGSDRFQDFKNILMISDYCWLEKLYSQCSGQMREEIAKVEAELQRMKGPGMRTELGTLSERIDCIVSELVYRLMILHFTMDPTNGPKPNPNLSESDAGR